MAYYSRLRLLLQTSDASDYSRSNDYSPAVYESSTATAPVMKQIISAPLLGDTIDMSIYSTVETVVIYNTVSTSTFYTTVTYDSTDTADCTQRVYGGGVPLVLTDVDPGTDITITADAVGAVAQTLEVSIFGVI